MSPCWPVDFRVASFLTHEIATIVSADFIVKSIKSISVFGLGKLGACIAATFAQRGFDVVGIDIDAEKVRRVNEGLAPVQEPLLAETIFAGHARLRASSDARAAAGTDASFFIPPSPSLPDGSFSNEYLLRAMQSAAQAVREAGNKNHLFVCNSTTTPGTMDSVLIPMLEEETGWVCGQDFGVCYNPEFIALGNVINGLLEPDMVLIGESDAQSGAALEELNRKYNRNKPHIARMSLMSGELTKISVNSFITMKISFTNQLRLIAEKCPQADIHAILDAIGSDSRIGRKYLRAGLSFGGPCFPRDNRLLAYAAKRCGLRAPLAEASDLVNEMTKERLLETVTDLTKPKDTVAVLGLAYKPDTWIVEESAGLHLAQSLHRNGRNVLVHDYAANRSNSPSLFEFGVLDDPKTLRERADVKVVVLCCPWPGYAALEVHRATKLLAFWRM